jgi:hypothetical protein
MNPRSARPIGKRKRHWRPLPIDPVSGCGFYAAPARSSSVMGRDAVYQLAALTIGARLAVADA